MKGMLSKAFSLALLISVVPSFAMESKVVGELSDSAVIVIDNAAQKMADAASAQTAATNGAISGVAGLAITNTVPTLLEKVKGYANSAAAYATTDNLKTAGKYALGLAAVYAGYKAAKAVYNYVTTPATKKAVAAKPVVKAAPKKSIEVVITPKDGQEACELMASIVSDVDAKVAGLEAKYSKQLQDNVVLNRFVYVARTQLIESVEVAPLNQLLSDIVIATLHIADKGSNEQKAQAKQVVVQIRNHVATIAAGITGMEAMKPAPKVTLASRAYNALFNRYTLGGAAVIGSGVAAYKYGIPFYNRTK